MVVNSCSGISDIVQLIEVQEIRKNLFFLHFQINIIIIDIWDIYKRGYYCTLPLLAGIVSVISNDPPCRNGIGIARLTTVPPLES